MKNNLNAFDDWVYWFSVSKYSKVFETFFHSLIIFQYIGNDNDIQYMQIFHPYINAKYIWGKYTKVHK